MWSVLLGPQKKHVCKRNNFPFTDMLLMKLQCKQKPTKMAQLHHCLKGWRRRDPVRKDLLHRDPVRKDLLHRDPPVVWVFRRLMG